jgi:hypothetical protein
MNSEIRSVVEVVESFIRENPDAKAAFAAMRSRGRSRKAATEEIARVLFACLREAWGDPATPPERLTMALRALGDGQSAASLFPPGEH